MKKLTAPSQEQFDDWKQSDVGEWFFAVVPDILRREADDYWARKERLHDLDVLRFAQGSVSAQRELVKHLEVVSLEGILVEAEKLGVAT